MPDTERKFFDVFKRYTPSDPAAYALLCEATEIGVRYSRDPFRIEVNATFTHEVDDGLLFKIEEEARAAYEAVSFRLFPHFPPATFSASSMPAVITEAERTGVVTRGFFYNAVFSLDGETLTASLPFIGGLEVLENARTADLLSRIIENRYGRKITVCIASSEDAEAICEERRRMVASDSAAYEKMAAQAAAAAASASHPPVKEASAPAAPILPRVQTIFSDVEDGGVTGRGTYRSGMYEFDLSAPENILGGAFDVGEVLPLSTVKDPARSQYFLGEVFEVTERETRRGDRVTVNIGITDGASSIYVRKNDVPDNLTWAKSVKTGMSIAVCGNLTRDKFDNELFVSPTAIASIKRCPREDNAEEKRVELHLHTTMSAMDALIRPDELVATATRWGHEAVAVTDHGNVQAFPELMLAVEKQKSPLKIIYGMEAYYVDDTARVIWGNDRPGFDDEMIVFDIETTGLSPVSCRITEIGAVLYRAGEVVDTFDTFVDPEMPIPPEITRLTSITDEMVAGAPKIREALEMFFAFAESRLLIAHNANFDVGFIRTAAMACGLPFTNSYLDTVALSRYVNPDLAKHKLDTIAEYYNLGDFHHHRASDDAAMLAAIFARMVERLRDEGIDSIDSMVEAMSEKADPLKLKSYHMVILAANKTGLKNLYRLVSAGYLTYYKRHPRIPRSLLEQHREGLIIGSACEAGELFTALLDGTSEDAVKEIASFYDYLEIQPICNNRFLILDGKVQNEDQLRDLNRRIVALGRELNKPVVATCDAHFLNKEDEIYRKILLAGMKFADADRDVGIYYRTTDEMLREFDYLGEDVARAVVIDNPRAIAARVEKIRPIPEGQFPPHMDGAEEELQERCWGRAHEWYGDVLPEIVEARLKKELDSIIEHGFAVLYMIAQKLVAYSESQGYLVGSRGSVGSSFVAIMAGISEVNPLPPHYRCPACRYSEFITDGSVGSGFDLPAKKCPVCGKDLYADGNDIPFETFLGFYGDKSPDIDLNFSGDVQGKVHKYTEQLFGEGNVYRAGTTGTLADKTAYGFIARYLEEKGVSLPKAEVSRLISRCVGVKRTTGQHPGGIIVVPREYDVYDFTPIQHPADDPNSDIVTTHFQFSYLHDTILKLDELGHDIPTKYKMLERYTNTSVLDVNMNDRAVYELFLSTSPLGVSPEDIGSSLGTYGIPEFGTRFAIRMLEEAKPRSFADLLQISGLSHGTDVWTGNAQDLIRSGTCNISQVIGCRDNIMNDLIRYGVEKSLSFKIMESVRKGRGLTPEWIEEMKAHDVPDWYIDSCKKIKYMFPKAHATAYVMSAIRLGWYKIYYPMEFYAGFFTVAPGGFDAEVVLAGRSRVRAVIDEIEKKGVDATQKESETHAALLLANECLARGIQFLPIDLEKSDATAFLPENGKIRLPFTSLMGVGETAARRIVEARNESKIYSVDELRRRAGLTKTVVDILDRNKVLEGLSETNQITLF